MSKTNYRHVVYIHNSRIARRRNLVSSFFLGIEIHDLSRQPATEIIREDIIIKFYK
jgi:hypothetical protein